VKPQGIISTLLGVGIVLIMAIWTWGFWDRRLKAKSIQSPVSQSPVALLKPPHTGVLVLRTNSFTETFELDADNGENIWFRSFDGEPISGTWLRNGHEEPFTINMPGSQPGIRTVDKTFYSIALKTDAGKPRVGYYRGYGNAPPADWFKKLHQQHP
jgi:hypothetical protein